MKLKRILAVVLCIAMVFSTINTVVLAEDTADYSDVVSSVETVILDNQSEHTFAVQFNGKEPVESYFTANADSPWKMNVFFTANKDITFSEDNYFSVENPRFEGTFFDSVCTFPTSGKTIEYKAGEKIKVLDYYWSAMSTSGSQNYDDLFGNAGFWSSGLSCGIKFTDEFLEANQDLYSEISLVIYQLRNKEEKNHITLGSHSYGTKPVVELWRENSVARSAELVLVGSYATIEEAFEAAEKGDTIKLLADLTPSLTSQRAITDASVIDLNGHTLTLTEDDLYFGTITFKNGTVVVDPSVVASTAVFWMYEGQTLTFDDVDIVATGVTGTYLMGINGGENSAINIINGSTITIDNDTAAGLSAVICDNGTGNSVVIEDSVISVENIDGRFYLGGTSGTVTVTDSDLDLNGVKEGFYLRANQELSIEGTSTVDITLNSLEGRNGINITDATVNYSVDETATVNALHNGAETIYISSLDELKAFRDTINAGHTYESKTVILTADIDISGEEWVPVGNGTRSSKTYTGDAFRGVFDGGNYTINGLTISSASDADAAAGLFGVVDGGTVKNLNLTNVDINVADNELTGAAIGMMLNGAVADNITVSGSVIGYDGVGGIAGRLIIDGTISNCTNNADVTSSYGGIGGIVGKAYYEDSADTSVIATISNCTNNGTITAPMYVGGIAGLARANVVSCTNNGAVVGGTQTGGILGQLIAAGNVEGNVNKADISGKNHLGGIIGDYTQSDAYTYNNVTIEGNTNYGDLSATESCGAILGCNNIDGFTAMVATYNISYYYTDGLVLFFNPEDMVYDDTNKFNYAVADVDGVEYDNFDDALAAVNNGGKVLTLYKDITREAVIEIGTDLTVNGNGHTITSSANRVIRVTASDVELTMNDVDVLSTAVMLYPNDVRGISIDPNLSNVVLTLNDCSVKFADESTCDWTYGVNVAGNGSAHTININGGEYEGANVINVWGASNIVNIDGATLISIYEYNDSYHGQCIRIEEENGAAVTTTNTTFEGEHAVAYSLNTGSTLVESNNTDNTKHAVAKAGTEYYYTLADALAAGGDVKLIADIDADTAMSVPANTTVVLDLNGKTITGTDNATSSFGLINIQPGADLTINDAVGTGVITLTATNERNWNAYSSVISNQRGTLTVNGGTIEHLGGTAMAYAIDNLTNGKGTKAVTTVNGGTIKSSYIAIRQFLNGVEADNTLTINGGVVEGAKRGVWMQDASKAANSGTLTITDGADVNGTVQLSVTAGSTEWPVTVSIARSAIEELTTSNVPAGYEITLTNGNYGVSRVDTVTEYEASVNSVGYETLQAAIDDALVGDTVKLLKDLTIASDLGNSARGYYNIADDKNITLDFNGKKITATETAASGDFNLFYSYGTLNVTGNGVVELTATNDRNWSASSSIFMNRGGVLNVENGTFTHNGGTAMAYVIDNSGNSYGDATATVNDGALKSSYTAIRNRMEKYGANGNGNGIANLDINGGTFEGTRRAIWGQVSSSGGAKGNVDISAGTFIAAEGEDAVYVETDDAGEITTVITGGTFSSDVSAYAAEGFTAVYSEITGLYSVVEKRTVSLVANGTADTTDNKGIVVKTGDEFTVDVKISGLENTKGVRWELAYVNTVFDFVKMTPAGNYNSLTTDALKPEFIGATNEFFADGATIATYTFKAREDLTADAVNVAFTLSNAEMKTGIEAMAGTDVTSAMAVENTEVTVELRDFEPVITFNGSEYDASVTTMTAEYLGSDISFSVEDKNVTGETVTYTVNGVDMSEVKLDAADTYIVTYTVTKPGYETYTGAVTVTVEKTEYYVEVKFGEFSDYVSGTKLVLVYTPHDGISFDFDGVRMLDVSDSEYLYQGKDHFDNIYALVVDAAYGNVLSEYEDDVTVVYNTNGVKTVDYTYTNDVNCNKKVTWDDIMAAYTVLEKNEEAFASFMAGVIKTDTNCDMVANTSDITPIITEVYSNK